MGGYLSASVPEPTPGSLLLQCEEDGMFDERDEAEKILQSMQRYLPGSTVSINYKCLAIAERDDMAREHIISWRLTQLKSFISGWVVYIKKMRVYDDIDKKDYTQIALYRLFNAQISALMIAKIFNYRNREVLVNWPANQHEKLKSELFELHNITVNAIEITDYDDIYWFYMENAD